MSNTSYLGLVYKRGAGVDDLTAYCDAAFATKYGAKSRLVWLFMHQGNLVSWSSENPKRVVTSSTEAE